MVGGWFFGHFFGRWRGQCAYTIIHIQMPYIVINVQGGGGDFGELNIRKLEKFGKLKI